VGLLYAEVSGKIEAFPGSLRRLDKVAVTIIYRYFCVAFVVICSF